jgi:hypothetical protein
MIKPSLAKCWLFSYIYRTATSAWPRLCGLGMSPSSLPVPLWPRLLPGRKWKWCLPSSFPATGATVSAFESPNRDRKLFFFGSCCLAASSFNFTSSKAGSSTAVGLSNVVLLRVERVGKRVAGRESNDERELKLSAWRIGERPEMSCAKSQSNVALQSVNTLTKDLLYDSKDSREIVNASLSLKHSRWFVEVEEGDLEDQKDGRSVGDGYRTVNLAVLDKGLLSLTGRYSPLSFTAVLSVSLRVFLVGFPGAGAGIAYNST